MSEAATIDHDEMDREMRRRMAEWGRRGGLARAARLTPEEKSKSARIASRAAAKARRKAAAERRKALKTKA